MSKLSLIIPVYKGEKEIELTLALLAKNFPNEEIIVVNDCSPDKTKEKIFSLLAIYPQICYLENEKNSGKGFSLKKGVLKAKGEFIIFTDHDLPYGIEGINKVYQELLKGAKIVIGKRKEFYNVSSTRKIFRPFLYFFIKIFFGLDYEDTQCGLKGFEAETGKKIFSLATVNRFGIDIEILYLAKLMKIPVEEVIVEQKRGFSATTFHFKDFIKIFLDLLKIRFHHYEIQG